MGYVNVQGLSSDAWEAACSLLNHSLDYLFLAETWYVDHHRYRRDRRLIASTDLPPPQAPRVGRPGGGIYLLGTHGARGRLRSPPIVTERAITMVVDGQTISGVYFAPSLPAPEIHRILESLPNPTIILGDINTRFHDAEVQSGKMGPPDRVAVFSRFCEARSLVHGRPMMDGAPSKILLEPRLTVDHTFLGPGARKSRLRLLNNRSINLRTDHRYTIHLTIPTTNPTKPAVLVLPRYQNGRLVQGTIQEQVKTAFAREMGEIQTLRRGHLDEMNAKLVRICQRVAEQVLGRVGGEKRKTGRGEKRKTGRGEGMMDGEEQTMEASVRLYKRAVASSKENEVIQATSTARAVGKDAMTEVYEVLKARYQSPSSSLPLDVGSPTEFTTIPFSREEIADEIRRQDSTKSCGADGIHIRLLKALVNTSLIDALYHLFRQCLMTGKTPAVWNETEIHLNPKDTTKAPTIANRRPITLICMFRKVFEKLLLRRFDEDGWAHLHPNQAGFRSHYSTCTNAAILHHLLRSRLRRMAIFLDFRSAFDVLDHRRLSELLRQRGCPDYLHSLIRSLMFDGVRSRVLVNGEVSGWFLRTQGVLQGSPLSPWLFNLFVDGLLYRLNTGDSSIPRCLFYADDGVVVPQTDREVQPLLDITLDWSRRNGLELNVGKCGFVSQSQCPPSIHLGGEEIALVEEYPYLGFPVRADGIDFAAHLTRRVTAARKRSDYLSLNSDDWGCANRLRIYKQYLAPMFEYGAPLVWAWAEESGENKGKFREGTKGWKELMAWVSHSSGSRFRVTANLCGLTSLEERFRHLRTCYQWIVERISTENPFKRLLGGTGFLSQFQTDPGWERFKQRGQFDPTVPTALRRYLGHIRSETIQKEARKPDLTSLIPFESRKVPGLLLADIVLAAPRAFQDILLQYRRGVFHFHMACACGEGEKFHRGHESCSSLPHPVRLTRPQRLEKAKLKTSLHLKKDALFTDVDFLLNTGRLKDAIRILSAVQTRLRQTYHEKEKSKSLTF